MQRFRYIEHLLYISNIIIVARCVDVIISCISVCIYSSLPMRRRSSTTAAECSPSVEKRCNAIKAKVTKCQSASSTDRMISRQT